MLSPMLPAVWGYHRGGTSSSSFRKYRKGRLNIEAAAILWVAGVCAALLRESHLFGLGREGPKKGPSSSGFFGFQISMCVGIQTEKHSYSSLHIPKVEVSRGKMKRAGCCGAGVAFSHDFYTTLIAPGADGHPIRWLNWFAAALPFPTPSSSVKRRHLSLHASTRLQPMPTTLAISLRVKTYQTFWTNVVEMAAINFK